MTKPLTMTNAEEVYFRSVAMDPAGTYVQIFEIARKAFKEIDALRKLPVVERCGQCRAMQMNEHYSQEADGYRDVRGSEHCGRDAARRSVLPLLSDDREHYMPPPEWCPLRGAK